MSAAKKLLVLSPEDRARVEHVENLARAGKPALAELIALLAEPSWAVRRSVVAALASLGDEAVSALVHLLETQRDSEATLAAAVDTLVAARGESVNARMIALTRSLTPPIVCDAVQVLGRRRAHASVDLLTSLSRHADDNVAVGAIEALGRIGGGETVDALVLAVEARHFFRTFPAIDALGRTGDVRAVAPLAALLADPLYALEAARGLGHTGDESAVAALASLLTKPTDALVRTAVSALAELRERYEARFGDSPAIAKALPEAVSPPLAAAATRHRDVAWRRSVGARRDRARARLARRSALAIEQLVELALSDAPVGPAASDALRRLGARCLQHRSSLHILARDRARRG